jgi:hypothetical protein
MPCHVSWEVLLKRLLLLREFNFDRRHFIVNLLKINATEKLVFFQIIQVLSTQSICWVLDQNLSEEVSSVLWNSIGDDNFALFDEFKRFVLSLTFE